MSKSEIVATARRVLAKEIDPLEGCRDMVRHQDGLSEAERRNENLITLVAIESETDHYAMGVSRELWDPTVLAEQDRHRAKYMETIEARLMDACANLIREFSQTT